MSEVQGHGIGYLQKDDSTYASNDKKRHEEFGLHHEDKHLYKHDSHYN